MFSIMKNKLGIIVQARLGSTRLPHKLLKPFYKNSGILEVILDRLKINFPNIDLVVATTTNPKDDDIVNLLKNKGVQIFRGSEHNVLKRFIDVAEAYNFDSVVRVCADNPFLNVLDLKKLIAFYGEEDADYVSYGTNRGIPSILTHYGFWAEIVKTETLKEVLSCTQEKFFMEHVTNFIHTQPERFRIKLLPISAQIEKHKKLRLTVDTKEDFELTKKIYNQLSNLNQKPEKLVQEIILNTNWLNEMKIQIDKNKK